MLRPIVAAAAAIFCAAGASLAQPAGAAPASDKAAQPAEASKRPFALMVGDTAPPLQVEKWVKGEPVTGLEKGKVYLVEFWATWCGPCITAMPHLTKLQKEYKDDGLTVIALTSIDPGNSLEAVERMVEQRPEIMGFKVAWDTERKTNEAYMRASGQSGIPCSFLVDRNGRIAYIGHPMSIDKTLEEVIKGTHDIEKAAESYARRRAGEARMRPLQQRFGMAMSRQNWDDALAVLDEIEKIDDELAPVVAMQRFFILLQKGDARAASDAGRKAVDVNKDNAGALNAIAWTIIDPDGDVEDKDLDLALRAATRAAELTDHNDASILDTLALAHFLKGNTAKAIELQTKAVSLADESLKEELEGRLEEFKAKK